MMKKDDRARVFSDTFVRSSHAPSKLPEMTATIPERNEPSARALTENHTAALR